MPWLRMNGRAVVPCRSKGSKDRAALPKALSVGPALGTTVAGTWSGSSSGSRGVRVRKNQFVIPARPHTCDLRCAGGACAQHRNHSRRRRQRDPPRTHLKARDSSAALAAKACTASGFIMYMVTPWPRWLYSRRMMASTTSTGTWAGAAGDARTCLRMASVTTSQRPGRAACRDEMTQAFNAQAQRDGKCGGQHGGGATLTWNSSF